MATIFVVKWFFAISPILVVLILMIGLKWGGGRAGAAGWFAAMLAAFFVFGADARLLAYAQMKGILLSVNVLYIIWMALLLYNVVNETGAVETIGLGIGRISQDKAIQILIFGWVFGSFLQGVAGYGVPIAVVAPLLVSMGFTPIVAVAVPTIAHCWSVTFGSMGASFQALMTVTGLGQHFLAPWSAIFLGMACFLCALAAVHVYGGFRMVRHALPAVFAVGIVMAGTQYALAVSGLWTLGGFGSSLIGLVAVLLIARFPRYNDQSAAISARQLPMSMSQALMAYILLIIVVSAAVMIDPVRTFLGQIKLSLFFPALKTGQGWAVAAGFGKKISVFGHGGALLGYVSLISFVAYHFMRRYRSGALSKILHKTINSGVTTSLGIVSMVCFAIVMDNCGMIHLIAEGISRLFGASYAFAAVWIGLLGAFMTGSNTNSNVVFGALQLKTAELSGISAAVILAAQTTGGALGSMIAPAKIIVGCSTVGLGGKEGPVLAATIKYGVVITSIIGFLTLIITLL